MENFNVLFFVENFNVRFSYQLDSVGLRRACKTPYLLAFNILLVIAQQKSNLAVINFHTVEREGNYENKK